MSPSLPSSLRLAALALALNLSHVALAAASESSSASSHASSSSSHSSSSSSSSHASSSSAHPSSSSASSRTSTSQGAAPTGLPAGSDAGSQSGNATAGAAPQSDNAPPPTEDVQHELQAEDLMSIGTYWYYYFIAAVLALFFVRHVLHLLTHSLRRGTISPSSRGRAEAGGAGALSYKPRLAPLPLAAAESAFTTLLARPVWFGCTLVEIALTLAVVGWDVALLFIQSLPAGQAGEKKLDYISKRGGAIAVANMVMAFALAGRNNVLSVLTGIDYGHLRTFHKVVGFLTFVFSAVHGLTFIAMEGASGGSAAITSLLQAEVGMSGLTALAGAAALFLGSLWFVRRAFYELFLVSHILGYVAMLVGVWYHVEDRRPQVYACVALLTFERLARVARKAWCGGLVRPVVHARAEVVAGAVVLRVPYPGNWTAGSHAYVMLWDKTLFGRPWRLWQAHPFSIANVPYATATAPLDVAKRGTGDEKYWIGQEDDSAGHEMLFVCRVKSGMTRVMADLVQSRTKERGGWGTSLPVSLEGPYPSLSLGQGASGCEMDAFESALLFAGGSGVTHTLSMLLDTIRRARAGVQGHTLAVDFVWVVQDVEHVAWVSQHINAALATPVPNVKVNLHLFVTSASPRLERVDALLSPQALALTSVQAGRPDVPAAIADVVSTTEGSVLTVACGPAGLSRAVQAASADANQPGAVWRGKRSGYVKCHIAKFE